MVPLFIAKLSAQPMFQLAAFLLITIALAPIVKGKGTNAIWNLAGLLYIVFIITNTVFIFQVERVWTYFFISLGASLLYILAIGVIIPLYERILKLTGPGESATVFLFIIYHPVVLGLAIFVRWIIEII